MNNDDDINARLDWLQVVPCKRLNLEELVAFHRTGHDSFVVADNIVKRKDIKVDFIWDVLERQGKRTVALNVPFIVPPYCFGIDFRPVGFGLPTNEREWQEELERITDKTKDLLAQKPDLLISVYTLLDRIQHFHLDSAHICIQP